MLQNNFLVEVRKRAIDAYILIQTEMRALANDMRFMEHNWPKRSEYLRVSGGYQSNTGSGSEGVDRGGERHNLRALV